MTLGNQSMADITSHQSQLHSQPQSITVLWPTPNYTHCWQTGHLCAVAMWMWNSMDTVEPLNHCSIHTSNPLSIAQQYKLTALQSSDLSHGQTISKSFLLFSSVGQ